MDNTNCLGLTVPSYMDPSFFEKVLKSGLGDNSVAIDCVQFTQGPNHGENYLSEIYRADISYSSSTVKLEKVSLIIKVETSNNEFHVTDIFGKEKDVYSFALPKIEAMLDNGEQIAPKMYYATCDPIKIIVFADMNKEGYRIADRISGLDETHCGLILDKLAKFHAGSMQVLRNHPEAQKRFEFGMFQGDEWQIFLDNILTATLEDLVEAVKLWPGYEAISEKLRTMQNNLHEIVIDANCNREDDLTVLTHNDLWTNNILFKYDDEKPVDSLLIDFQVSYYCSLGIDIVQFLYTSPYYELIDRKRDFLIEEYYYKSFRATLEKLGYTPVPSLQRVLEEIESREMSGFIWAIDKLYLILLPRDDCEKDKPTVDNLADPEICRKIRAKGMATERYQNVVKYLLRRMDASGKI